MSALCLYELDRPKLQEVSAELKTALLEDDRARLAKLLELGEALAAKLGEAARLVDLFLLPESDPRAAPLMSSLRRVSRKRSMERTLQSSHSSLEGRLRGYDVIRDDKVLARSVDRLMSPSRLPWYLRRAGATCGWIDGPERKGLCRALRGLRPSLTPELVEFLDALERGEGDVVLHDSL